MRVACLVPYPLDRVPGQRFRLEQWAGPLAEQGIRVEFVPFLSKVALDVLHQRGHLWRKSSDIVQGCAARLGWVLERSRSFDVVVIYREAVLLGIDWIERMLVERVPTVYDFDDAVWLPNVSSANRYLGRLKGFSKVNRILSMVSAVSAGCEYLAEHARAYNSRVFVTPTSVDLVRYDPPRAHQASSVLRVGWSGSITTGRYLELVAAALRRASERFPLELTVLGAQIDIPGVQTRCIPWSAESEVEVIRTFDVGLKPVPREEWVRGKCPMKDIQYMALGIPPVATRFGTASESIEHGATGFLCDSDDDWVSALDRLRNPALRSAMGARARAVVEACYSASVAARAFAGVLDAAQQAFAKNGSAKRPSS